MKTIKIALLLVLMNCSSCGVSKVSDLVETDGITNDFHRQNAGKVLFSSKPSAGKEYETPNLLTLSAKDELHLTILLDNSLTNYLHWLAPEVSISELDTSGNYQFTFLVDGETIYISNLHPGAPRVEEKHRQTRLDKPLLSYPFSDWWSAYLWNRFMSNGGLAALTPGEHDLRIEIRPYLEREQLLVGEVIAAGDVTLDVIPPSIEDVDIDAIPVAKPLPYGGLYPSERLPTRGLLQELRAKIEARIYRDITSVVALQRDSILIEEYYNNATRESLHDVRSVGKTFTSTLLGMAIADGYLESESQQLGTFYPLREYDNYDERKSSVALYDLLTMSSAFLGDDGDPDSPGNEELMYPTDDWVRFALNVPVKSSAERQWNYFTAGVVVLGDILHQRVPNGLEDYAKRRLFTPLGITSQVWQHTPQGVANTAGGIQMTSLDFAKYGLLYNRNGRWDGKEVLPQEWVRKSFTKQIAITDRAKEYYGFLFWNKTYVVEGRELETYYCAGNGGNRIFVFPQENLVVVVTATAYGMNYAHSQVDEVMELYVLPAVLKAGFTPLPPSD